MEQTTMMSSDGTPIVPEFNGWLEQLVDGEGSDLHVKVGKGSSSKRARSISHTRSGTSAGSG